MQDVSPTQATAPQPVAPHPPGTRARVSKFVIPEVIFGIGRLAEVDGAVRRVGGHRPTLISDPGVLTTMPAELTAHTGLDALSHAIESCVSEASEFLSRGHAVAADGAIACIEALTRALDIPAGLRVLDVEEADFGRVAVNALRDVYITTSPPPVTESDVRDICVAAY